MFYLFSYINIIKSSLDYFFISIISILELKTYIHNTLLVIIFGMIHANIVTFFQANQLCKTYDFLFKFVEYTSTNVIKLV